MVRERAHAKPPVLSIHKVPGVIPRFPSIPPLGPIPRSREMAREKNVKLPQRTPGYMKQETFSKITYVATLLLAQGGQGGPWQGSENTGPYKVFRDSPCGVWTLWILNPVQGAKCRHGWVRSPLAAQVELVHCSIPGTRGTADKWFDRPLKPALITRSLFATTAAQLLTENNTERTIQSEVTAMLLCVRATYVDTQQRTKYRRNLKRKKRKAHTAKKIVG